MNCSEDKGSRFPMQLESQLNELGEERLVARLLVGLPTDDSVLVGAGDDCAVVAHPEKEDLVQLLKTDSVIEGVHYLSETDSLRVGWKAVARVISDFAAMGGRPTSLLVTIALRQEIALKWVDGLYEGIRKCTSRYGATVVGGETVSLPEGSANLVSIAGVGVVSRAQYLTRGGGEVGDHLWVTGKLGGSFVSERHLDFEPRVEEGQWIAHEAGANAMMDLSDGLRRDLPRLADASGCGFEIDFSALPCHEGCGVQEALGDGEDMELLFAAPSGDWVSRFRKAFPQVLLTRIGSLVAEERTELGEGGWQHFQV